MKRILSVVLLALALISSGCATRSANIAPGHVSHYQYSDLSCSQLSTKMSSTSSTLAAMSKKQDNMATTDAVAMTVGLVVFWPALIVNAATPDHKQEIAELKGTYEALEMAMIAKQCGAGSDPRNFAHN